MRKTLFTKMARPFFGGLAVAACFASSLFVVSCEKKDSNADRPQVIEVYADPTDPEGEPLDAYCVGVKGGFERLYVKSNIDFTATWEDSEATPWVKVLDVSDSEYKGYKVVTLNVKRRSASCYYTRRSGMLILSANDLSLNFNKYLTVHQGATARVSSDFAWLAYGSSDPRILDGDTAQKDWSVSQKDRGYNSTVINGQDYAYCYGKNGYLRLGDDKGHGADLHSPYTSELRTDSLLMVSFKAVAYTDHETQVKDANYLKVEVLNGGVIRDFAEEGLTSMELEAGYYDTTSEEFPGNMWDNGNFNIFVVSTEHNPITINTMIRITAGSLSGADGQPNNRIFLDNFYIRTLNIDLDEDYFTENGGSGLDQILGVESEEPEWDDDQQ